MRDLRPYPSCLFDLIDLIDLIEEWREHPESRVPALAARIRTAARDLL